MASSSLPSTPSYFAFGYEGQGGFAGHSRTQSDYETGEKQPTSGPREAFDSVIVPLYTENPLIYNGFFASNLITGDGIC